MYWICLDNLPFNLIAFLLKLLSNIGVNLDLQHVGFILILRYQREGGEGAQPAVGGWGGGGGGEVDFGGGDVACWGGGWWGGDLIEKIAY